MHPPPEDVLATRAIRRLGATLCGRYRVERLVGIGGMAAVYFGVHRSGHPVAIKVLHERLSSDPEVERLFRREALLANRIEHPGVVPVIDDDVSEDGCIFLVMPFLEGETLGRRARRLGSTLPTEEVVVVAHAVLEVLEAAHARKVVHRDIKPENILVTCDGGVRVLDFGVARFFENNDPASATRSGRAVGTPAFMAPEQALGRTREVDGRTDLWALGAMMFTLLTGRLVHEAETSNEIMVLSATRKTTPLEEVAPWLPLPLCEVINRALAFDRDARWRDAASMIVALQSIAPSIFGRSMSELDRVSAYKSDVPSDVHGEATRPPDPGGSAPFAHTRTVRSLVLPPRPRRPLILAAAAAAFLGVAGVAGLALSRRSTPSTAAAASVDERALRTHLAAAHAAWLGARPEVARQEAHAALRLDASSAEARLDLVRATTLWPSDDDRANFVQAQDSGEALSADDRAYLEALAPGMTVPADYQAQAKRLEGLHGRSPGSLAVSLALADSWIRINRSDDAARLLEPLATASSPAAVVLAAYGNSLAARDDVEGASSSLNRCTSDYPGATTCLTQLAQLDLLEGRCADAERLSRKELAVNSGAMDAYLRLASALDGEGAPADEVRHVLDKCIALTASSAQPLFQARFDEQMALVEGRFQDALAADARIEAATAGNSEDSEHFDYVDRSMTLKAELGLTNEASTVLHDYTVSRQDLLRDSYGGDNVMYLNAIATQVGVLPWSRWLQLRSARLASHLDRDDLQDGPQRTWLEYFAFPVHDEASAREALAVAPKDHPFLRRSDRWPLHDGAIGNTLSLAGQQGRATEHFERASLSCTRLDNPIEYVHALMQFGQHLERTQENARACDIYGRILTMWPAKSGSVTASMASARLARVCSMPAPAQQSSL